MSVMRSIKSTSDVGWVQSSRTLENDGRKFREPNGFRFVWKIVLDCGHEYTWRSEPVANRDSSRLRNLPLRVPCSICTKEFQDEENGPKQ